MVQKQKNHDILKNVMEKLKLYYKSCRQRCGNVPICRNSQVQFDKKSMQNPMGSVRGFRFVRNFRAEQAETIGSHGGKPHERDLCVWRVCPLQFLQFAVFNIK